MTLAALDFAPVSVVIPAFRAAGTIASAIESVAAQTLWPMEVIVVDDGSNDGTAACVERLAPRYPPDWLKLKVLRHNEGAASARNAGWDLALGEYVAFLDADDTWHPRKLELQYGYLRDHPDVALCGHRFHFAGDPRIKKELSLPLQAQRISSRGIVLSNPFITPSVMVRSDVPLRFHPGKRHMEDHLLWMEIVLSGYPTVRISAPLAVIGKAQFGERGLSAQLWAMERGELHNYRHLRSSGHIGGLAAALLMGYSLAKFGRRLLIVAARRLGVPGFLGAGQA